MAAKKKTATKAKKKAPVKAASKAKSKLVAKSAKGAVKRATVKRASSSKAVAVKKGPISVGRKPFSKSQMVATIVERTGVARKEVLAVLETIPDIIKAHVKGPEAFSWAGLFKIIIVKKPATKARQGINPFTGEMTTFKAKPASKRVKIRPLKQLKEMAS